MSSARETLGVCVELTGTLCSVYADSMVSSPTEFSWCVFSIVVPIWVGPSIKRLQA